MKVLKPVCVLYVNLIVASLARPFMIIALIIMADLSQADCTI